MNQLEITALNKVYKNGTHALNDVHLTLKNGMFGLLGPNGAGKSSLMKTIAGLQPPDKGKIIFNGKDIVKDPFFIKKQLGFLPQDFGVYPKISASDLLHHIAKLKGINQREERKEQVNVLLEKVNLYTHRKKEVYSFSGGMRQRFGIAQALLGNPQLIIADEPTAGLDPEERNRFNNLLSEIGEDIIVILSTHLVDDVKNLCTEMAVMNHGKIMAQGKPSDFINDLKGQVWKKNIDKNEKPIYESKYELLSTQFSLGRLVVHVKAEMQPEQGFEPVEPELDDVYFSILSRKN
jgi:ABC-2 type transport system ATP-binding protein